VLAVLPWFVVARALVLVAVIATAIRRVAPARRRSPGLVVAVRARATAAVARHAPLVTRVRRCLSVSVVTTALTLVSLVVLTTAGVAPMTANLVATSLATVLSYQLNRRWTWNRRGTSDLWREVVPFWALSFAGLALSTVTVGNADQWAARAHVAGVGRTAAVLAGHLGGFGLLWIVQFVVLDRLVFGQPDQSRPNHRRMRVVPNSAFNAVPSADAGSKTPVGAAPGANVTSTRATPAFPNSR
jgi:putative flippase GtrA